MTSRTWDHTEVCRVVALDGDRVLLMGVGSGLNGCCTELEW